MKACDTAAAEGCAAGMAAADGPAADTCRMIIIYMNEDHYIYMRGISMQVPNN